RLAPSAFERTLFVIRKLAENTVRDAGWDTAGQFHIASLSSQTLIYKGMLLPAQLPRVFHDLRDPRLQSAIAVVHSRFSTNTFPSWALAQPLRFVAHNGEINTVRGNRNWMQARRRLLHSTRLGGSLDRLFPIVAPEGSDSAQFDNLLELLHLAGRSLPHAMMMMVPEAWEQDPEMSAERQAFYAYQANMMEPWDGPAAMVFSDGIRVGAGTDRNGLRPARWWLTRDDRVVLASETGVLPIPADQVVAKGRLRPGRMFLVDTEAGRLIHDDEVKGRIISRFPYASWLAQNTVRLTDLPSVSASAAVRPSPGERFAHLRAFGYSEEDMALLLGPMAATAKEPIGSMGNDTPLAVLSDTAPSLFDYFHQSFAQVTNPPIDPLREGMVMSLTTTIGQSGNPFEETPEHCHGLVVEQPILTNGDLARIENASQDMFRPCVLPMVFTPGAPNALEAAVKVLCEAAEAAVERGDSVLILSDRMVDATRCPIPALLALSAVHQHLVRVGTRLQAGLIVSTGEAREVHHFALLLGYGAAAVNPWLALDAIAERGSDGARPQLDIPAQIAQRQYIAAIGKGLLKVMAKMGISTLQSYRGAQIFEAVGLASALIDAHFTGTVARLAGLGLPGLAREARARHARGYIAPDPLRVLPVGGRYRWRRRGEHHQWNPQSVALLRAAIHGADPDAYAAYEAALDGGVPRSAPRTLRAMLTPVAGTPISIDAVEPVEAIVKRFVTGAMSFGSISPEAHETLALAMNRLGGRSNSGEGGEEPWRSTPTAEGSRRSAIRQVASGRFGVTTEFLVNAEDLQIKIAQGAKPGEGGQLPGHKVDVRIAKVRCSTPGVTLISPPPHHNIYSIEDLKQLIYDLRAVNPTARISVKLVAQAGVGTVASGVVKAGADVVVLSGWSGGTGASPLSSLKHAGVPWELGVAETQQVLRLNHLRSRVRLQADGGMRTGRDVIIAALLGAEEFGFATAALIAEGCVLLRKCHENTCAVGIATQDPRLRALFSGTAEGIVRFFTLLAGSIRQHLAALGVPNLDALIGQVSRLRTKTPEGWKSATVDLSALLHDPVGDPARRCMGFVARPQREHLDHDLITAAAAAIDGVAPVHLTRVIHNVDRAVGARLGGEITRQCGAEGLSVPLTVNFTGSAGQSFGAFLVPGVTFHLSGDTNDYLGKGLSGGCLSVRPPAASTFAAHHNVITGNTALYGATRGTVFVRGQAGERFAVRNSGAEAVIEGVGDHGCEYMTGGTVIVLGEFGRNFGAGMSGGLAFLLDADAYRPAAHLETAPPTQSDLPGLHRLLTGHLAQTDSPIAAELLVEWPRGARRLTRVMPIEYRLAL
ncbi:MAG: glutamate synthase (NADPH/NADH) large chain, partial [Bradymonadia bacterium]